MWRNGWAVRLGSSANRRPCPSWRGYRKVPVPSATSTETDLNTTGKLFTFSAISNQPNFFLLPDLVKENSHSCSIYSFCLVSSCCLYYCFIINGNRKSAKENHTPYENHTPQPIHVRHMQHGCDAIGRRHGWSKKALLQSLSRSSSGQIHADQS